MVAEAELDLEALLAENRALKARLRAGTTEERLGTLGNLEDVLDAMEEGLQVLDAELRYLYLNEAAARHGRRSARELLGRSMSEMYPGVETTELFSVLARCAREQVPHRMENEFTFPDGSKGFFELRIQPVPAGVLVLSIDITDRLALQTQLAQAQKMEAIGRMAGGIAHDFNNLLTIIGSYARLIASALPDRDELQVDLACVSDAVARGSAITRQLLALGRNQKLTPERISIQRALADLEPMIRRLVREQVEVRLDLGQEVCPIEVDPGQFDQVVLNLAANARDAMPNGGQLGIRTGLVVLDEAYASRHLGMKAGRHVMLAVSDTGVGMDAETRARIFDPFFTTKATGEGTGLGLSTTHGIVRQAGGHIWVYSEPGHGTTFKVYFPCAEDLTPITRQAPEPSTPEALFGSETVLVVEDDGVLRKLCARVLREFGYTVIEADDAEEALHFAERFSGRIDALVTDTVLPGRSGPELAERLLAVRPRVRVLYMSGYAEHSLLQKIGPFQYLEKPFTPESLVQKLRGVLPPRTIPGGGTGPDR